ncbi:MULTISPECIES: hypothetical protein [Myxococcus]|nr:MULTISPECIES: hypothetical protein [Myxococcus]QPM76433.1 hypothetical protein I5Q59_18825 [Myxococcus xanthus]QVW65495.1 hypothetical protein JTM82_24170 [Myxococcus xanthus DZ2]QZZ51492.1 hypothetical protein MyxoNM_20035 [Myxococcus xanthus]UEO01439.1 hypothetical protein K1515_18620 [Myxococcus xanthus DZ2]UYI11242.1 hypothetical protein N3T43_19375 [Myxococcus xanthus]
MLRVMILIPLLLVGAACQRPLTPEEDRAQALEIVRSRASVAEREGCPAEAIPERQAQLENFFIYCDARLSWCAKQCFKSDATACYALAVIFQNDDATDQLAEPLFYRSCTQGVISGCSNRAAGLQIQQQTDDTAMTCAVRTFEKTCALRDPWGCAMHGFNLVQGTHTPRDLKKAREVLGQSCRDGEDDPACQAARGLQSQLDAFDLEQATEPRPK